ncbi:MAG: hypothetical protein JNK99_17155 [Candidatus Accumulibacter sp.]|uniref:hypothetical protein n=1 Tax=Accumulibacter sp. TaxID=2053492 RepID=UPI001A42CEFC|nr:hypothetical protein [Accumulibacter sp.]MBL8396445.1 hypothetical protein [Accumulibacter sp.]
MNSNKQTGSFSPFGLPLPGGVLARLLTMSAGALLLVVGFMFSLLALGVLLIGGTLIFAYLKWQARHLRRQPGGSTEPRSAASGRVIEGEVIGDAEYDARLRPSTKRPANGLPARYGRPPGSDVEH